jgi:hypothetical protein
MSVPPPQPYDELPVEQQQLIDIAIFADQVARIHGHLNMKLSKVTLPDDTEKRVEVLRELFASDLQSAEQHYIEMPQKNTMRIIMPLLFEAQSNAALGAKQDIRESVRKKGAGIRSRRQFEDVVGGDVVSANRQLRDLIQLLTNLPYSDAPYIEDAAVSKEKNKAKSR